MSKIIIKNFHLYLSNFPVFFLFSRQNLSSISSANMFQCWQELTENKMRFKIRIIKLLLVQCTTIAHEHYRKTWLLYSLFYPRIEYATVTSHCCQKTLWRRTVHSKQAIIHDPRLCLREYSCGKPRWISQTVWPIHSLTFPQCCDEVDLCGCVLFYDLIGQFLSVSGARALARAVPGSSLQFLFQYSDFYAFSQDFNCHHNKLYLFKMLLCWHSGWISAQMVFTSSRNTISQSNYAGKISISAWPPIELGDAFIDFYRQSQSQRNLPRPSYIIWKKSLAS